MRKKEKNGYLLFGLIFASILLLISLFGDQLAPYGKDAAETFKPGTDYKAFSPPPHPPSFAHPAGTDENGYDLLSRLLRGAKYTLSFALLIGLSRLLLAVPIGMTAGWWHRFLKPPVQHMNRIWVSLPLFLIAYFLLEPMSVTPSFSIGQQLFWMWLILTLAGLPPLVETMRGHVERIRNEPFIEGAKILGGSGFYLLRRHFFPHLLPHLPIILSMEMAQVLWLLGQLGIFHVFLGGTFVSFDFFSGGNTYRSMTDDWAGLIGFNRKYVLSAPWILLSPAFAFFFAIFSFTILAEGLKRRMDRRIMRYDYE
ncbi:putative ABC-type dipeptide/oligopeptide/nickel transport system, permease component [[Clostridium] ultunense Esp]|uniref:ABC transporter permease subunit n=1 Tax=Thermicanus aegyptius TaxID=94009 RepID=UPI0002B6F998|nr:ABC transporter permease subunit [Thermicanus aegyptius]CCQ96713.1 putative ABC-type dipeptide/oligopeptide/nickel transport system, permease component [[Clostridium] ultunense Esp]